MHSICSVSSDGNGKLVNSFIVKLWEVVTAQYRSVTAWVKIEKGHFFVRTHEMYFIAKCDTKLLPIKKALGKNDLKSS